MGERARRAVAAGVALLAIGVVPTVTSPPSGAAERGPAVGVPSPPPLVVDPPSPPLPPTGPDAARSAPAAAPPFPLDQTFLLHSTPGSNRTIYLDVDGASVSGTAWNGQYGTGFVINAAPYSLDGSAAFSDTELANVQEIWQRVSEDYAPFDVDVTTQAPLASAIQRSSAADQVYGTTAVITNTSFPSCNCGGIAYIGVVERIGADKDQYQPAWVFTNHLSLDTKNIAEATSHEVGHNFGLNHDGTKVPAADYSYGQGLWAPIMGAGYQRPLTQFSKGEYAQANNQQDDLATITDSSAANTNGGVTYKADVVGDTHAAATALDPPSVAAAQTWSVDGLISTTADRDVYEVTTTHDGDLSFTATAQRPGPDLDVRLTLERATTTVDSDDPPSTSTGRDDISGIDAAVDGTDQPAGTYFLTVEGVGSGDPAVDGYSDYGSLGRYTLAGSFSPTEDPPPPPADVAPYDFTGDGLTDAAVFRPSTGRWYVAGGGPAIAFGTAGDIPVPGQWDADAATDVAVFRPSTGRWYVAGQAGSIAFGTTGDVPVPADYDGDGLTDIAVFRPSTGRWYVRGGATTAFGTAGDIPVPGDYDHDGTIQLAVFRPSTSRWYVAGRPGSVAFGTAGDVPIPGDYDGDGRTDLAVFRPSAGRWYVQGTAGSTALGQAGDVPVPGQWAGTVTSALELGVFRPSTSTWTRQGVAGSLAWGTVGDIPVDLPYAIRRSLPSGS